MLEICQRKGMFLSLGLLVALTVVVLMLESHYAIIGPERKAQDRQYIIENNSTCWQQQTYDIIQACHKCSDYDSVARRSGICVLSKYKEVLRCLNGEIVIRSCDRVVDIERKNFHIFLLVTFWLALSSYVVVFFRERVLERRNQQKLQRLLNNAP